jgi:hypothetical protein
MKVALRLGARVPWLDQEGSGDASSEGDANPLMAGGTAIPAKNDRYIWAGVGVNAWSRSILGASCFCNAGAEATPAFSQTQC